MLALILPLTVFQGAAWGTGSATAQKALPGLPDRCFDCHQGPGPRLFCRYRPGRNSASGDPQDPLPRSPGDRPLRQPAPTPGHSAGGLRGGAGPLRPALGIRPSTFRLCRYGHRGWHPYADRDPPGRLCGPAARGASHLPAGSDGYPAPTLCFPRLPQASPLSLVPLARLGNTYLVHRDLNGADGRGPFEIHPLSTLRVPTYPALWAHDQHRERHLEVEPEREAQVRPGQAAHVQAKWSQTASRLHFTLDVRINSQSLAARLPPEPCIGGRAWPNFLVADALWEPLLVLWANSTLGLMLWWWQGSRQQPERASITLDRRPKLPVIDPRVLTEAQLTCARHIYDNFKGRTFLPAYEAYRDETRQALDCMVLVELLGLPVEILSELDLLRRQWCEEPSVYRSESKSPIGR